MHKIQLWVLIMPFVFAGRPAFRDVRTFFWACVVIMEFCTGVGENACITSIIMILNLLPHVYTSLVNFFHSSGVDLDGLRLLLNNW